MIAGASRKRERPSQDTSQNERVAVSIETLLNSNFEELARRFPEFGVVWAKHSKLQTPEVRTSLAKTLLQAHFRISLAYIPDQYLCPPVPNRYFYVRWMLDEVLPITGSSNHFEGITSWSPAGAALDIGTGAFCIYPLLLAANDSTIHRIFAADIDASTLECAQKHVVLNNLTSRLSLLLVPPSHRQEKETSSAMDTGEGGDDDVGRGPLRASLEQIGLAGHRDQVQFAMTNPPFYDIGEVPISHANMTQNEGYYPGGETAFGMDMIMDGLCLYLTSNAAQSGAATSTMAPPVWTSTMCGKKASWVVLRNTVTQLLGPGHVCAAEFGPGTLTRWFLAWTFAPHPNAQSPLARHDAYSFHVPNATPSDVADRLRQYCATFPWGALNCTASDSSGNSCRLVDGSPPAQGPWKGDEELPSPIRSCLSGHEHLRNQFLPREGHFCIQVNLKNLQQAIRVDMVSYVHSENGRKTVDKIRGQIEGEICRTNRRWRRKLKLAS